MDSWKDVELYERGLKHFESLTPAQRDWFTIKDLDIYYEMEGGFEDYLLSGSHAAELEWLEGALRRLGDVVSLRIMAQLRRMGESQRQEMHPLCRLYFDRRDERWRLLMLRLEQHGVRIDESL